MLRIHAMRPILAGLLVFAQPVAGSLAAQMAVRGVPCAAHAAAAVPSQGHSTLETNDKAGKRQSDHAQHAGHEDDDGSDTGELSVFGAGCCSDCATGMTAALLPLPILQWVRQTQAMAAPRLKPDELPGADPPPRILLYTFTIDRPQVIPAGGQHGRASVRI
jgi:hypothetical protein